MSLDASATTPMIRLEQTFGAHAGRTLEFEQERVTCGRLPGLDLSFDPNADLDASGRHAEIRRCDEGWVLVDVGSRNGTFVHGRRVSRHVLRDGDEIEFGSSGPRVRVRLAPTPNLGLPGLAPAGALTAAATPLVVESAEGKAATMLAAAGPTPRWQGPPTGDRPPVMVPPTQPPPAMHPPIAPPGSMPPSAPASIPPMASAPGEPRRYGERTVGLMIGAALEHAGSGSTDAGTQQRHAPPSSSPSTGLLVAVGCLGLLVVGLAVALAAVLLLR